MGSVTREFRLRPNTLFTSKKPYAERIPYPERLGIVSSAQDRLALNSYTNPSIQSLKGDSLAQCCSIDVCIAYFDLLCVLLFSYCTTCPSMLLCVSLDCLADDVSPPSGAIRNRRSIEYVAVTLLYLRLLLYATLVHTSTLLILRFCSASATYARQTV